ncbi:hypothetical protein GQ55_9G145900 [Panicum hallii var. hallii]|uniref:Uncharacterized protein n=1 Tax=Panicum hallii var. hallii TaxID=1504633 RepID=A0A2T7C334_9POAL|nr:hypothetical protein GQ55_9G145900 [Panicum hallii var. hallii]
MMLKAMCSVALLYVRASFLSLFLFLLPLPSCLTAKLLLHDFYQGSADQTTTGAPFSNVCTLVPFPFPFYFQFPLASLPPKLKKQKPALFDSSLLFFCAQTPTRSE